MKKLIQIIMISMLISSGSLYASTPVSIYKQIGSIAALSESCLNSTEIPVKLEIALDAAGLEQSIIDMLIEAYNEGYKSTILNHKIWKVSSQTWDSHSFDCNDASDIDQIKQFESYILNNL